MLLIRAIHVGATVLAAGVFAFFFFIARGACDAEPTRPAGAEVKRWLWLVGGWSLLVAGVSWIVWLGLVSASMSGRPLSQALTTEVVGDVLTRTAFGEVWVLRLALMALLGGELVLSRRRARLGGAEIRPAGALLAAGLLMTLAWAGHAIGTERSVRLLHLAADAAHLLAAGLWFGALIPLLFVLGRARTTGAQGWIALAADSTQRFSMLGVFAFTTLLATGLINAWLLVGSVQALVETPYGRLLSIKIALFGVIVWIAAINRLKLRPRLLAGATWEGAPKAALEHLRRNVIAEISVGAIILVIVGGLGVTPPPYHMRVPMNHHTQAERPQIADRMQAVGEWLDRTHGEPVQVQGRPHRAAVPGGDRRAARAGRATPGASGPPSTASEAPSHGANPIEGAPLSSPDDPPNDG